MWDIAKFSGFHDDLKMYPSIYPIIMFVYPWILYFCLHFRKVSFWTPVTLNPFYLMVEFLCIHIIIILVNVSMDPQSNSKYTLLGPGYIFIIKTKMLDASSYVDSIVLQNLLFCIDMLTFAIIMLSGSIQVVPWIPSQIHVSIQCSIQVYLMYFMHGINKVSFF